MTTLTHTLNHTLKHLGLVTFACSLALLGSLSYAQWNEPTAQPPQDNVASPLNVSSVSQEKAGNLTVGGLAVNGRPLLNDNAPTIQFQDTDHRDWFIHTNSHNLYFLADRDDDGSWEGEAPWPLVLSQDDDLSDGNDDFARFSNQVRAAEYCDYNGENCTTATTLGGGGGSVEFGGEVHQFGLRVTATHDSRNIGQRLFCAINKVNTYEDDDNNYDGCAVTRNADGSWSLSIDKHFSDSLFCSAICIGGEPNPYTYEWTGDGQRRINSQAQCIRSDGEEVPWEFCDEAWGAAGED
ncbi:MAG: hypothetical protein ACOC4E_02480 [Patescibacteria group bacterium]